MSSEKKNETMKTYYANNKDKMKEWFKLYYQYNKEKIIEQSRNYYWNPQKQNYIEHKFETVSERKPNYNKKKIW